MEDIGCVISGISLPTDFQFFHSICAQSGFATCRSLVSGVYS